MILFEFKFNQNSSFPRKQCTLSHISQHDTASVLSLTFTSTTGLQWKKRWNVTFRNPGLFDYRSITFSHEAEVHGGRNEGWILRIKLVDPDGKQCSHGAALQSIAYPLWAFLTFYRASLCTARGKLVKARRNLFLHRIRCCYCWPSRNTLRISSICIMVPYNVRVLIIHVESSF